MKIQWMFIIQVSDDVLLKQHCNMIFNGNSPVLQSFSTSGEEPQNVC